jgi:hypothetical protein
MLLDFLKAAPGFFIPGSLIHGDSRSIGSLDLASLLLLLLLLLLLHFVFLVLLLLL